tara:strand:+ start:2549 stop:3139 length:591 start_codon:yes stop_codon:yes gene_type:complete
MALEEVKQNSLVSGLEATYKPKREVPDQTLDKDDFLELLLVQMQNQDPLEPMDNTESIAQMAEFSALEQMTNLNTSMDTLLTAFNNTSKSNALSMIGRNAEGFVMVENPEGDQEQSNVLGVVRGVDYTSEMATVVLETENGNRVRVPQNQIRLVEEVVKKEEELLSEEQLASILGASDDEDSKESLDEDLEDKAKI